MSFQTKLSLQAKPTNMPVQQGGGTTEHYTLSGALTVSLGTRELGLNHENIKLKLLKDGLWQVDSDHPDHGIAETQGNSDDPVYPSNQLGEYAFNRYPSQFSESLWYQTVYDGASLPVSYEPAASVPDARVIIGSGMPIVYTHLDVTDKIGSIDPAAGGKVLTVNGNLSRIESAGEFSPLPNQYLHAFIGNPRKTAFYGDNGEVRTESDAHFVMTIPIERLFGPDYGGSYNVDIYYMGSSGCWDGTSVGANDEYMNTTSFFTITL